MTMVFSIVSQIAPLAILKEPCPFQKQMTRGVRRLFLCCFRFRKFSFRPLRFSVVLTSDAELDGLDTLDDIYDSDIDDTGDTGDAGDTSTHIGPPSSVV